MQTVETQHQIYIGDYFDTHAIKINHDFRRNYLSLQTKSKQLNQTIVDLDKQLYEKKSQYSEAQEIRKDEQSKREALEYQAQKKLEFSITRFINFELDDLIKNLPQDKTKLREIINEIRLKLIYTFNEAKLIDKLIENFIHREEKYSPIKDMLHEPLDIDIALTSTIKFSEYQLTYFKVSSNIRSNEDSLSFLLII